jgi:hypothetical protein
MPSTTGRGLSKPTTAGRRGCLYPQQQVGRCLEQQLRSGGGVYTRNSSQRAVFTNNFGEEVVSIPIAAGRDLSVPTTAEEGCQSS